MFPETFANPAGFWALLAIPAIVLIHFLQRQSVELPVSTLFLLETLDKESVGGKRFERIRQSLPLWLQILVALLLAWVLAAPRWERSGAVQRIAIVVDCSASMAAFRDEAMISLQQEVPPLLRPRIASEFTLVESHREGETLYHGSNLDELVASLANWEPRRSAHQAEAALRAARSVAGEGGLVLFLTDHAIEEAPFGAQVLSVGRPLENVGFTGVAIDATSDPPFWRATIRNYGTQDQTREWILASGNRRTEPRTLELEAGETRILEGRFPEDADRIRIELQPDRFTLDDRLPAIVPRAKPLVVARRDSERLSGEFDAILRTLESVRPASSSAPPDLTLSAYNPLAPDPVAGQAVVCVDPGNNPGGFSNGALVATNHPLMEGLNWQGLLPRKSPGFPTGESPEVLLWQDDRPLIFLATRDDGSRQLVFNFDVPGSNVTRLPAFIVLVHRFAESVRRDKIAPLAGNFELDQALAPTFRRNGESSPLFLMTGEERVSIPLEQARILRAPGTPGFFRVQQDDVLLIDGAAHFADTREADFSHAASGGRLTREETETAQDRTLRDDRWALWLLVALGAILLAWYRLASPSREPTQG